jgi:hypothetical protein
MNVPFCDDELQENRYKGLKNGKAGLWLRRWSIMTLTQRAVRHAVG